MTPCWETTPQNLELGTCPSDVHCRGIWYVLPPLFYCSCYSFWAVSLLFPAGHALQLFYPISCTGHCARLRGQISSRAVECHFGFHCVSWKPWRLFCSTFGASSWHILYTVVRSDPLENKEWHKHTQTQTHIYHLVSWLRYRFEAAQRWRCCDAHAAEMGKAARSVAWLQLQDQPPPLHQ